MTARPLFPDALAAPAGVKLLLLAVYLAFDYAAIAGRVASLGLSAGLVAYAVLFGGLVLALGAAALTRSTPVRIALAAVLALGSVALHSYEWTTGSPLTYEAFETMLSSAGSTEEALAQHGVTLLRAIGAALVLFAAIALPPGRFALPFGLGAAIPAFAVLALAVMLYLRGGEGSSALPAPFPPLAEGTIMATLRLVEDQRPREPVALVPLPTPEGGDVVLVIDESIAALYLDINHPDGVRSGLADAPAGVSVANFGVAASITNCSAGSNQTLHFGGTRENYREAAKVKPSIWAYAHRAGFRTVLLDGQGEDGSLSNPISPEELAEIDDFVQVDETPVIDRDHELARLLAGRLKNGVREVIVVNKVGGHFPVADKFPDSAALYRPIPPRGRSVGIAHIAGSALQSASREEWRLYRNAYRNTVGWNTGGFFDILLPQLAGTGATILYTADHGQNLHEAGDLGGATHCTVDGPPAEGAVPLVVIAEAGAKQGWQAAAKTHFDGASHYRLFPTLLGLMGYAEAQVKPFYGPTLTAPERDPLTFTPSYNASLGRDPSWRRVARADLAAPPVADYRQVARAD